MNDSFHHDIVDVLKTMRVISAKIMADSYAEFRVLSYRNGVSSQEILRELIERLVAGDPALTEIVNELAMKKREGLIKKLSATDADTIYDAISVVSPMSANKR